MSKLDDLLPDNLSKEEKEEIKTGIKELALSIFREVWNDNKHANDIPAAFRNEVIQL